MIAPNVHIETPATKVNTFIPTPRCVMSNTRQIESKTNPAKTRATPVFLDTSDLRLACALLLR
jgi:hypothetical protein